MSQDFARSTGGVRRIVVPPGGGVKPNPFGQSCPEDAANISGIAGILDACREKAERIIDE